jgi:hypothetical protein
MPSELTGFTGFTALNQRNLLGSENSWKMHHFSGAFPAADRAGRHSEIAGKHLAVAQRPQRPASMDPDFLSFLGGIKIHYNHPNNHPI